ncbi:MAG TPA: ABC transporter permease [Thermomicrobiales bacterium]|nr:ABC transporter permease [Thermomicrobiales bacterium]
MPEAKDRTEPQPATASRPVAAMSTLAGAEHRQRSEWRRSWNRFARYRPALFGLGFVSVLLLFALLPAVFAPHSPTEIFPGTRNSPPSSDFWLGVDNAGRDMLSRIIFGTRTALIVGVFATGISILIGMIIGSIAGYFGGWTDALLSRIVDTVMAFPILALLVVLASVLGPSIATITIIIGTTFWTGYARVVRADMLSVRERDFVLAARSIGVRTPRLIVRHMLPNILGPVIVLATLGIGGIIITEAALSFLGLGVQPPTSSWGRSLSEARPHIIRYPHLAIAPGVMITLTVLAFNVIGDGLRDALDPRQQE